MADQTRPIYVTRVHSADYKPALATTTWFIGRSLVLLSAIVAPTIFDNPRAAPRQQPDIAHANIALNPPPAVLPFSQHQWPQPLPLPRRQPDQAPQNLVNAPPAVLPFRQLTWPTFRRERRQEPFVWSANTVLDAAPAVLPFAEHRWPNPMWARPRRQPDQRPLDLLFYRPPPVQAYLPVIALLRDHPVSGYATMSATAVATIGEMADSLPVVSIMFQPEPPPMLGAAGAMSGDAVAVSGALI